MKKRNTYVKLEKSNIYLQNNNKSQWFIRNASHMIYKYKKLYKILLPFQCDVSNGFLTISICNLDVMPILRNLLKRIASADEEKTCTSYKMHCQVYTSLEINLSQLGLFMRMLNRIVPSYKFYIHITLCRRGCRNAVITRGTSVCKLAPWTINTPQKLSPIVRVWSIQVRVISCILLHDTWYFVVFRNILIYFRAYKFSHFTRRNNH